VRLCERNNSADTKVNEEGGRGGAQDARAETFPLQPMEKTMVMQAVPLQPMEVHSGADIHLQPVEWTPRWSRCMPEVGCDPMGSPCWSRLMAGPVDPWRERSPCWSRFAGRACDTMGDPRWSSLCLSDCTPWKGLHTGAVCEELQPLEGLTLGKFVDSCLHERDPTLETRKSVRSPPPEEEGVAETTCDELTVTPTPCPPVLLGKGGQGGRETGVKLSPGRREGWGEGVLRFSFISHYPTLL